MNLNKKTITVILISITSLILISGIIFVSVSKIKGASLEEANTSTSSLTGSGSDFDNDYTYIAPIEDHSNPNSVSPEPEATEVPFVPATEMDLDPSSITVFVNKEFAISKDYKPDDLVIPNIYFDLVYYDERTLMRSEAAAALEKLFLTASEENYSLCGVSGYRSYERQYKIFTENILTKGKEHTLKYSAVPGTSEHQTGLTMDLSSQTLHFDLSSAFADLPEGKWLAENAHLYGFIIRYPEGKADITGYAYEPWHIRYVGKGLAKYLYLNNLTLEEYYNYQPGKDFDFMKLYADLINITPVPSAGFPLDGTGFVLGENGEIIEGELGDKVKPSKGDKGKDDDTKDDGKDVVGTPTPTLAPEVSDDPDPTGTVDPQPTGDAEPTDSAGETTDITPTPTEDISATPTLAPTIIE